MDSKWRSSEQGSSLCFWMIFESAYEAKSKTVYVIILHWWFSFWLKMALSLRRDLLLILWTQCLCRHQLWAPRSFWDTMYGLVECQPWKESDHWVLPHHFPCGKAMPRDTELIGGLGTRMHLMLFLSHHPARIETMSSYQDYKAWWMISDLRELPPVGKQNSTVMNDSKVVRAECWWLP